jgi:hypothetical protein
MQEYFINVQKRKEFDEEFEYVSSNFIDLSETFDEATKIIWDFQKK